MFVLNELTFYLLQLNSRLSVTRRAERRVHKPNITIILRISSPHITDEMNKRGRKRKSEKHRQRLNLRKEVRKSIWGLVD